MWKLGAEHPAAHAQSSEISLVAEALGEASRVPEHSPGVQVYDRILLSLCAPLFPRIAPH